MRLVEYYAHGFPRLGVMRGELIFDALQIDEQAPGRMLDFIRAGMPAWRRLQEKLACGPSAHPVGKAREVPLAAPLPNAPKLLCVAANYREHIAECGFAAPQAAELVTPQFFCKFPSTCIIGPGAAIPLTPRNVALDWELELAVVIGRGGKHIRTAEALDHVFGYTIINDISERKLNSNLAGRTLRDNDRFFDWLNGKWFDGSAPLGPAIVTSDEIPDPQALEMRLEVNGEVMQESNTGRMITPVTELIAYISGYVSLEPGDIIATGTPEGVGASRGRFLAAGDRVVGWIEGLGCLENSVAAVPALA